MIRHSIRTVLLALAVACFVPAAVPADPANVETEAVTGLPTEAVTSDSTKVSPTAIADSARAAYQTAWALREAGEHAIAIITANHALAAIEMALAADPDATTRRDLVELQSRLRGLRDAAQHKVESGVFEPGNEADT